MALHIINGAHSADEPTEPDKLERVWTSLPKALIAQVDDFHFGTRCKSRPAALLKLIELGLQAHRSRN
jgi:metal-responsive CopG/Arc/MetJ family transcriptional regulator